jgi:hypothetical protein
MPRIIKCVQAGLAVSAVALLTASAALAGEINVHVPTPEIHVPTPQVHVRTPEVHVHTPDANLRIQQIEGTAGGRVPSVVGNSKVKGQRLGDHSTGDSIPGVSDTSGGVSHLNTPGTLHEKQEGSKIPGIENNKGGAASLNLPGTTNQHSIDDADKAIAKLKEQQQDLLNQATQGGPNALNTPTSASAEVTATDKNDNGKKAASSSGTSSSSATAAATATAGSTAGANAGAAVATTAGATTSSSAITGGTTAGSEQGAAKANETLKYIIMIAPAAHGSNKKGTPDDTGANTTSTSKVIDPHSGVARKDYGGGPGNNTETSDGKTGGLSPNSAYARRNQGDGGNDAGDNNDVNKGGSLANGTPLARKDYGDGGNSDGRGDAGGRSTLSGIKVSPSGGGDPHQSTLSGSATKAISGSASH